ncbi:MAG: cobyrinate a,c-diamide synthase [Actinobacteria bacterium]|nr:cobyrinate a,c-diamide synthase [Actinomycetota bacterium]
MTPLVIAGSASGVGKTTIATGIMGALKRRGLKVAPFKSGPDYIDPGFHLAVTGQRSRNLDTWLTSAEAVREIYRRGSSGADVSVIEGAMGLFDGRTGGSGSCSTAEVAQLTGGAVVLVVDCSRLARSLAPVLAGFAAFDRNVDLAGAVLNNAGSPGHVRTLEEAAREAGVPVLGVMPRREDIGLPSRHLGLVQAEKGEAEFEERLQRIIDHVAENIDIDGLLEVARTDTARNTARPEDSAARDAARPDTARPETQQARVRIAVARDEAFSFYYVDSLEALEAAGAELIYFSPLHDVELPECEGLYLGGGYPELYAGGLEANASMLRSVAGALREGLPAYAECGGLVYLCREVLIEGKSHSLAGALPLDARMTGKRQALGYVEAIAKKDNLLLAAGASIRGHEFHWSAIDWRQDELAYDCFSSREAGGKAEGFAAGNVLASYVHVHFSGNPAAAARFVGACAGVEGVASNVGN